jgi:hypothetical protein
MSKPLIDSSNLYYLACDAEGGILSINASYSAAKQSIREELDWEPSHRRDLGTLASWDGVYSESLPFSGFSIKAEECKKPRILALSRCLDAPLEECEVAPWADEDDFTFTAPGGEYRVLTYEEAEERALAYCRDTVWAFNRDFLSYYMPDGVERLLEATEDLCEDANDALLALLGDRADEAFNDAIAADGVAHFLDTYDGNESEYTIGDTTYYIYRVN